MLCIDQDLSAHGLMRRRAVPFLRKVWGRRLPRLEALTCKNVKDLLVLSSACNFGRSGAASLATGSSRLRLPHRLRTQVQTTSGAWGVL